MDRFMDRLHEAGDRDACDAAVRAVRAELVADARFSVDDLVREQRSRDTKGKGPMPYPSPGTACAIFGIVQALEGAIDDRRAAGRP